MVLMSTNVGEKMTYSYLHKTQRVIKPANRRMHNSPRAAVACLYDVYLGEATSSLREQNRMDCVILGNLQDAHWKYFS